MLLQTYLIYFYFLIYRLNNLKIYKFLIKFIYILFFYKTIKYKKIIILIFFKNQT